MVEGGGLDKKLNFVYMKTETETESRIEIDREEANFHYDVDYKHDAGRGLDEETIDWVLAEIRGRHAPLRGPTH